MSGIKGLLTKGGRAKNENKSDERRGIRREKSGVVCMRMSVVVFIV